MDPIIRFENVTKRFGAEVALDDVSFKVPPGVVFALLGENGAGKTTSIRIMLGLADANSGRSEVLGLPSAAQGSGDPPPRGLRARTTDFVRMDDRG